MAEGSTVTVNVSAAGIDMPAEIPSGIVTFVTEMGEDAPGAPEFARLNEGVTVEQLTEALQGDPMAALALASLLGTPDMAVDNQTTYDIKPGTHMAVVFGEAEGVPPLTHVFTAGEPGSASAPEATVTAQLADFAFVLPDEIAAGPQTWLVENTGEQWHEMAIIKLGEGMSVDDVMAMIMSEEEQSGPPPFEGIAFLSPMGAGERLWVNWDLPAGEYTVICFLPDVAGDMAPHAAHGMVRTLIVK
jgi:hypothetical protein